MVWSNKGKVAIVGVGFSKLTRTLDATLGSRTIEACINAVNDAGLKLSDIDGIASYPEAPARNAGNTDGIDIVTVNHIIQHLDIADHVKWYAQTEQGMVLSAVIEAINAVAAGTCNYALVWRALHRPAGIYGAVNTNVAGGDSQFLTPYGFGGAFQPHALAYQRYMSRFGATREEMATLAVTQRAHANLNEKAYFHDTPLTRDDYLNARMISSPLCLYDCDIPVEGAAAVVITSAERARDLKQKPAYIGGFGQNTDRRPALIQYTLVDYMKSGSSIAQNIWEMSGLGPKDVDVAELYDGFSPSTIYWIEATGFCKEGEGHSFIQDGRISLTGELPVNTHGGALSEGRLHSMGHLAEAVFQVTGRAGARQVADCHVGYVTAGSPMLRGSGVLVTSEP